MKIIKKILFFFSFAAFYFICKEFLMLYLAIKEINPILSIVFLIIVVAFLIYFVLLPVFIILKLPKFPSPVKDKELERAVILRRISLIKNNKVLKEMGIETKDLENTKEDYQKIVRILKVESKKLRDDHVSKVFLSTAIAQNGFIDGLIILSSSVSLIKKTFILYGGRVSYKDLLVIAKAVYYSFIVSASEGIETGIEELVQKLGPDTIKSVPFAGKLLESFADGLVSGALLCRVGLITENYCTKTYIIKDRELYPGIKVIMNSISPIADYIRKMILRHFKKNVTDRMVGAVKGVSNKLFGFVVPPKNYINEPLDREAEKSIKLLSNLDKKFPFNLFSKN